MVDVRYGHYTTTAGLFCIVKDQSLWATNIKFLNDEHEFVHAIEVIKNIISGQAATKGQLAHPVFEEFKASVARKLDLLDTVNSESVFTFSFSEEVDLLSQWRGYCPGNNGYCIVFDGQKIFEAVRNAFGDAHLVACVYDEREKQTRIRQLLNESWVRYSKLDSSKDKTALIDHLSKQFVLFASYFKHASFAEEKEHRIVVFRIYQPDHDIRFRVGRASLVPYIELPASRELIKKIYVGPNANKALAKRALELFMEMQSGIPWFIGKVDIEFSETPYRPW